MDFLIEHNARHMPRLPDYARIDFYYPAYVMAIPFFNRAPEWIFIMVGLDKFLGISSLLRKLKRTSIFRSVDC